MPTSKPDFAEVIAGQLEAVGRGQARDHKHGGVLTNVRLPLEMQALVDQAAREVRDISRNSYMRRAIMAMVVHDLGLDWSEVMAKEPGIFNWDQDSRLQRLAGEGHGPWRIVVLA